jgi:SnoaL-like domain
MSLEIESDLRDLIARSSDCVWRHDAENYALCWATDGEWHMMGEVTRGREAIVTRWSQSMSPYERVWQESHNIVFGFDGNQPAARLYLQEHLIQKDGAAIILKGVYHDVYTFETGAWRFARRHIDIGYIGPSDLSGHWFPMTDHGPGARHGDPSCPATPTAQEVRDAQA